MEPYFDDGAIRLYCGDCREHMGATEPNSIDAIVTDPPYGLEFMGKEWDKLWTEHPNGRNGRINGKGGMDTWGRTPQYRGGAAAQEWHHAWAVEAFRVLKPGGRLLAFGGTRTHHRMVCAIEDAGFVIEDTIAWLYGSGFPKHKSKLKPAFEPIVVAWKPDTRATPLNVDACRIGLDGAERHTTPARSGLGHNGIYGVSTIEHIPTNDELPRYNLSGRWPANVVLDEDAAAALDAQSGNLGSGYRPNRNMDLITQQGAVPFGTIGTRQGVTFADTGGASRFFYVAKASRRERGETNDHPTVKPLALMRWLVRLVTPPGGIVYDPFAGSGTTLLAAQLEGMRGIGCDLSEHNCEIAVQRLRDAALPLFAVAD